VNRKKVEDCFYIKTTNEWWASLTHLTSRSPAMMPELKKLFVLAEENDIRIRT
jgi:hypothetical protein